MKLVREHINETFTGDSDPIEDMGIGLERLIHDRLDILYDLNRKYFSGTYQYSVDRKNGKFLFSVEIPPKNAFQNIKDLLEDSGLSVFLIFEPKLTHYEYGFIHIKKSVKHRVDAVVYYWKIKKEYLKYFI